MADKKAMNLIGIINPDGLECPQCKKRDKDKTIYPIGWFLCKSCGHKFEVKDEKV